MILQILVLAVAWMALTGEVTLASAVEALLVAALCAALVGSNKGRRGFWRLWLRAPQAVGLALFFLYELVLSNLRVARAVLRGPDALQPAFVRVPIELTDPAAVTLLANLVTLTPGSLTVEVAEDHSWLLVHVIDGADPDAVLRDIQDGFQRRVQALFP